MYKYARKQIKKNPGFQQRYRVYKPAMKQLASDIMYLKGIINSEPHYHIVQSANNFNYNGIVVSLANIPVGDDSNNRTGERILPRYLSVNLYIGRTGGATATNQVMRAIIFRYWGETTSAAATVSPSEVLSTVGTAFAPLSHLNSDNVGPKGDRQRRIEILRNETFTSIDGTESNQHVFNWNIEMNGGQVKEHIQYRNSATGEPISGGLYILLITNASTATDGAYELESKLTFYDN